MLFLSFFYDLKNGHFCSYPNSKGNILPEALTFFLQLLDIPIWRAFCSMLTTDSYGNVHTTEKVMQWFKAV